MDCIWQLRMLVLEINDKYVYSQDKKINVYDIASMKLVRSFKQEKNFGDPIKVSYQWSAKHQPSITSNFEPKLYSQVTLDPSCTYLLCSYSNKCICIYDFITGEMITQAMGHGEIVTGVIFLPDCKHIISVSSVNFILSIWKNLCSKCTFLAILLSLKIFSPHPFWQRKILSNTKRRVPYNHASWPLLLLFVLLVIFSLLILMDIYIYAYGTWF